MAKKKFGKKQGYYDQQKLKTSGNLKRKLQRHIKKFPKDSQAKKAYDVRLETGDFNKKK